MDTKDITKIKTEDIKTEFEDYKDKQQYFKHLLRGKKHKPNVVFESRVKTVEGKFVGKTYKKEDK